MYDILGFYQAESVDDAIAALAADSDAQLISGGTDVLIQVREGRLAGKRLVSIHELEELRGISLHQNGDLRIGATTAFTHITRHPLIQAHVPALGEAVDQVGGPQIRTMGTIGGNVCNGVTSADSASTLMAYDAVFRLKGNCGVRDVSVHDWYTGPGKTVRNHDEILCHILIPQASYENFGGFYIKYAMRNAMDIATLGVSVNCKLTHDKTAIDTARIAYGVAAAYPIRSPKTEAWLRDRSLTEALDGVGEMALTDVKPRNSWRASRNLRLQLVETLTKRALHKAILRAGGEIV